MGTGAGEGLEGQREPEAGQGCRQPGLLGGIAPSLWNSAERSPADTLTVSPLSYSGSLPTITVPSFREQGDFNG